MAITKKPAAKKPAAKKAAPAKKASKNQNVEEDVSKLDLRLNVSTAITIFLI